jgi:hypothetical protein
VSLSRGIDGSDPLRSEPITRLAGSEEERRATRSRVVATGTLACPHCDAPVAPPLGGAAPAQRLACPFCAHTAPLREFLSLASPSRPARVEVRVRAAEFPARR